MSVLNTISSVANKVNIGNSALSLVGMGAALLKTKKLKPGIEGILFDIKMTDNISLSAQITDHYAEDNTYLQDHVAIQPMVITLVGKIGELVYTRAEAIQFLKAMSDRLLPLGILNPTQGLKAQQALAAYELVNNTLSSVMKNYTTLSDLIDGKDTLNFQQKAYAQLEALFLGRSLISVETPWRTFENMVIESISVDQDETTTMETTFTVTFKQMRFVEVKSVEAKMVGRTAAQISSPTNRGTQRGKTVDTKGSGASMLFKWLGN